jgi:hypothetical protein
MPSDKIGALGSMVSDRVVAQALPQHKDVRTLEPYQDQKFG